MILVGQAGSPGSGVGRVLWLDGATNGTGHGAKPARPGHGVLVDVAAEERRLLDALEIAASQLEALKSVPPEEWNRRLDEQLKPPARPRGEE